MVIDRSSPMPLYYQLKRLLLSQIESGDLKPGDIFPTEQQIQDIYDVSRTTVRQALGELESEGRIARHRGRGTFVTKPKISHSPDDYPNLVDHLSAQGLTPGWQLLSADWVLADSDTAARLQIAPSQKVFRLERLRLETDQPIGYHVAYVAPDYAAAIDHNAFTQGGSLRYLHSLSILEHSVADRTLEALSATNKLAALLVVEESAPLLRIRRVIHPPEGKPIEFFEGLYRGDRFQYHINNMRAISGINA